MNLHLQSHGICSINILASFIHVIIFNTLTFMTFLMGTHILSSTALQLLIHFSRLAMNG